MSSVLFSIQHLLNGTISNLVTKAPPGARFLLTRFESVFMGGAFLFESNQTKPCMTYKLFSGTIDVILIVATIILIALGPTGWIILVVWRLYAIERNIIEIEKRKHPHIFKE